jgi:hypothetical protein
MSLKIRRLPAGRLPGALPEAVAEIRWRAR